MSDAQSGTTQGVQLPDIVVYRVYALSYPSGEAQTTGTLKIGTQSFPLVPTTTPVTNPLGGIETLLKAAILIAENMGRKQFAQELKDALAALELLNLHFATQMSLTGTCDKEVSVKLTALPASPAVFKGSGAEDCATKQLDIVTQLTGGGSLPSSTSLTAEVVGIDNKTTGTGSLTYQVVVTSTVGVPCSVTINCAADFDSKFVA